MRDRERERKEGIKERGMRDSNFWFFEVAVIRCLETRFSQKIFSLALKRMPLQFRSKSASIVVFLLHESDSFKSLPFTDRCSRKSRVQHHSWSPSARLCARGRRRSTRRRRCRRRRRRCFRFSTRSRKIYYYWQVYYLNSVIFGLSSLRIRVCR